MVGTRPRTQPPSAGLPAHVCGVPAIPRETPAVEPGRGREAAGCGDAEKSLTRGSCGFASSSVEALKIRDCGRKRIPCWV
ncbi:hypothetical protein evm_004405 [Chilo suppressalis]|nr:hypothetical protein evm_004405 [Chilo suppressalis]